MPPKRPYSGSGGSGHRGGKPPFGNRGPKNSNPDDQEQQQQQPAVTGPYIEMFSGFRSELDEHHDRRERIIKASRDITAASKKIIFTLHRLRPTHLPVTLIPPYITTEVEQYEKKIRYLLKSLLPDLQGINGYRYQRQISGGLQEYLEAVGFRCYLTEGRLITFEEAAGYVTGLWEDDVVEEGEEGEGGVKKGEGEDVVMEDVKGDAVEGEKEEKEKEKLEGIKLTKEDYLLALFDMTGEMMRFAITSIATTPMNLLLAGTSSNSDITSQAFQKQTSNIPLPLQKPNPQPTAQLLLQHLRELRVSFEIMDYGNTHVGFGKDAEKKLQVMRECVEKVEYGFYGMTVRSSERPEGWVADAGDAGGGGGRYGDE